MDDDTEWWPEPKDWPKYGVGSCMESQALALLLTADVVFQGSTKTLQVICNDTFYYCCADCEPLPLVWGKEGVSFWDLYEKVRQHGNYGAIVWCCLSRKMRPLPRIEEKLKETGLWSGELDALPERSS